MSKKLFMGCPSFNQSLGTEATGSMAKDFASEISLSSCHRPWSFKYHHLSFWLMFTLDQNFADELGQVTAMAAD